MAGQISFTEALTEWLFMLVIAGQDSVFKRNTYLLSYPKGYFYRCDAIWRVKLTFLQRFYLYRKRFLSDTCEIKYENYGFI